MEGLVSIRGGGTAPYTVPCVRFYTAGGGRICTFRCVRFYMGGRLSTVPVFGLIQEGGAALYRPLCLVLHGRGGRLSPVPCVRFLYITGGGQLSAVPSGFLNKLVWLSMAFWVGDSVRYPPPVGRVEVEYFDVWCRKEKFGHPLYRCIFLCNTWYVCYRKGTHI